MKQHANSPLVVNFFAGPGAGKSTLAAALFATLKWRGVLCELVCEYAKDKVWEEQHGILQNGYYVFGKQLQRQLRLLGKVDVIITDAPILLSIAYNTDNRAFQAAVFTEFERFRNLNFFVKRVKPYVQVGRYQDEDGARRVDDDVLAVLKAYKVPFIEITGTQDAVPTVESLITTTLSSLRAS